MSLTKKENIKSGEEYIRELEELLLKANIKAEND